MSYPPRGAACGIKAEPGLTHAATAPRMGFRVSDDCSGNVMAPNGGPPRAAGRPQGFSGLVGGDPRGSFESEAA